LLFGPIHGGIGMFKEFTEFLIIGLIGGNTGRNGSGRIPTLNSLRPISASILFSSWTKARGAVPLYTQARWPLTNQAGSQTATPSGHPTTAAWWLRLNSSLSTDHGSAGSPTQVLDKRPSKMAPH
jgi:hypothetical protein